MVYGPIRSVPYEVYEWEAVTAFGKSGNTFLDIGANVGILSIAMSRIAGEGGKVVACEPNPGVYSLLCETVILNSCHNITPLQILLDDEIGFSDLHVSPVGTLGVRSSVANADPGAKTISLPSLTIDFLTDGIGETNYMKIDVEGTELRILRGAQETLKRDRPLVQVEVHGQFLPMVGDTVGDLFNFMSRSGFRAINLVTMREVKALEFEKCTHLHVLDPLTREDLAYNGYGQVLFIPEEKYETVFAGISLRDCNVCH